MGAAASKAQTSFASARNFTRATLTTPVNLTLLRGNSPESVPARAVNVSEGGLNTVVAGELRPFELVTLEFQLPDVGIPVKAKAWVRHQSNLRCGLEFTGLSHQQRSMIRYWLQRFSEQDDFKLSENSTPTPQKPHSQSRTPILRLFILLSSISAILLAGLGWWYWQSEWGKIENHLPFVQARADRIQPITVPADDVEKLLIHRIDPIYPEAARQANLSGVVKLDAVIGTDGTIAHLTALTGPDILQQAAMDSVKWWRFRPYLVNGHAAPIQTTIAVEFRP